MRRRILLISSLLLFVGIPLLIYLTSLTLKPKDGKEEQIVQPSQFPFGSPTLPPLKGGLSVSNVFPAHNTSEQFLPIQQVEIAFNLPVELAQFSYEISPNAQTKTGIKPDSNTTIVISPDPIWHPGITTITILPNTTSINGLSLQKPFVYKINTAFPKNPPYESEEYQE